MRVDRSSDLKPKWPVRRLADVLMPVERPEPVERNRSYTSLGVKWYAEGLFKRDPLGGEKIKAKRLFRVEEGDFIYNRLFAWKGSFAHATSEHEGCFVSGEFPTFRANATQIRPAYLFRYLSNPGLWTAIEKQSTGTSKTSRNRFKDTDFLALDVLVPPLAEQERIVRVLDEAEALRGLRRRADARTADLIPAIFHDMFGDPASNPKGWAMEPFGRLGTLSGGATPSKSRDDFWGGTIPWVSPKDMKAEDIDGSEDAITDLGLSQTKALRLLPAGSLLIVVRGMILDHTVPIRVNSVPVTINQDMRALLPRDDINIAFLRWALQLRHGDLLAKVTRASHGTCKLDTPRLLSIGVPLPPLALQREFAGRVAEVRGLEARQAETRRRIDDLFHSLLHRAFNGEL